MQDFRTIELETVSMEGQESCRSYAVHVGLDVHKDSIAVALAPAGREPPAYCGEIANRPSEIGKLAAKLAQAHGGELILFCYEAGPCGYEVYRQLTALGFDCEVVRSLVALRGVDRITAMTLLSELGDVSRFDSPRQLMAYLGLVPSEHSSGARRRQGGITRTGNGHVRRTLVESAWCYRFPARRTAHLERKAAAASDEAKAIAWKAQRRLCGRYRHLLQAGKNSKQANVAVARELSGFVWDIVCREMARIPPAPRPATGSSRSDDALAIE